MIRPCSCGSTPKLYEYDSKGVPTIQLRCQCGNHGATVYYTKPEDRERTEQAVIDGWNLSGAV